MGRVVVCHCSLGSARGEVRAQLEGHAVLLRGYIHADMDVKSLKRLRAEGTTLVANTDAGLLTLGLGEKEAALWIKKILSPPTLADKLGVTVGVPIYVHGRSPAILRVLDPVGPSHVNLADARLVFVKIDSAADLAHLKTLAEGRADGAQIWVIRQKGKGAPVSESEIMAAAKQAGLSPSKTAAWSEQLAADRYGRRGKA